ncbi:MAG: hypothetical protein Q7S64_00950 [bacterium]|nr:hypothetical protein [bacterium]
MPRSKVSLILFAVVVVLWQGLTLRHEFRSLKDSLNKPQVLGVSSDKQLVFPLLPDYPVLKQPAPNFAARNYTLYDIDSGLFLVNNDAETPAPLASTTKIMSTILALENGRKTDIYTVDQRSSAQIGSTVLLRPGERITVDNLLYSALLNSGNDAAYSLGHYIGAKQLGSDGNNVSWDNSITAFVNLMNKKAAQLNLKTLQYRDPAGLDDQNVGSAQDLARLTAYALHNKDFRQYVSTKELTVTNVEGTIAHPLKNSNRLVSDWNYPGAIGVKTGFTPAASHNLVAAVQWQNHTLIAVVLGTYSDTNTASAEVARDILDYAQRAVEWR